MRPYALLLLLALSAQIVSANIEDYVNGTIFENIGTFALLPAEYTQLKNMDRFTYIPPWDVEYPCTVQEPIYDWYPKVDSSDKIKAKYLLNILNMVFAEGPEVTLDTVRALIRQANMPAACTQAYCSLPKPPRYVEIVFGEGKDRTQCDHALCREGRYYWGADSTYYSLAVLKWIDGKCDCEAYKEENLH